MTLTRKLTAGAAAIIATLGLAALAPVEVQAANCSGTLVNKQVIYSHENRIPLATLYVFYDESNGGTNTACLVHAQRTWGVRLHTAVSIWRCSPQYQKGNPSGCKRTDDEDSDAGFFGKFAGPASVTGARDRCVTVYGHIVDPSTKDSTAEVITVSPLGCGRTYEVKRDWVRFFRPN